MQRVSGPKTLSDHKGHLLFNPSPLASGKREHAVKTIRLCSLLPSPPSQISAEVDREAAAPPHSVWETGGQWAESVSREAGCPGLLAPAATLCVLQGRRAAVGRLYMETMGLVFFHLCSQTCPGRELWAGQDVASRKVLRGGSRGCWSHWQVSLYGGM